MTNTFPFVYPLHSNGVQVAEIEGRATVDCEGNFEVQLYEIGGKGPLVPCDADLLDWIRTWLLFYRTDEINECQREAIAGAENYQREVAREPDITDGPGFVNFIAGRGE